MADLAVYLGLFVSAFAAATILPMQSEAVLVGLVAAEAQPVWALVAVASVGNVFGAIVTARARRSTCWSSRGATRRPP
jgi:membrane protein YqaA with SNARE-associated domain